MMLSMVTLAFNILALGLAASTANFTTRADMTDIPTPDSSADLWTIPPSRTCRSDHLAARMRPGAIGIALLMLAIMLNHRVRAIGAFRQTH